MVENLEQLNCKTDKKRGNTTLIATSGIITAYMYPFEAPESIVGFY
jgi:hypothetical protein